MLGFLGKSQPFTEGFYLKHDYPGQPSAVEPPGKPALGKDVGGRKKLKEGEGRDSGQGQSSPGCGGQGWGRREVVFCTRGLTANPLWEEGEVH